MRMIRFLFLVFFSLSNVNAQEVISPLLSSPREDMYISKNQNLENTVSTLMARLERLEKIASRDIKSQDLASIKD